MDELVTRADELYQALVEFVLEADGDIAPALEAFSATQLKHFANTPLISAQAQQWAIALFLTDGLMGDETPLMRFIAQPQHTDSDRELLTRWQTYVLGLFAVQEVTPDRLVLMNWLTTKTYPVLLKNASERSQLSRLKPGDIVVTRLSPISEQDYMLSCPTALLGRLGKPKLAVAIGNFRQTFPDHLYSDAPELLAEAWKSVERYHEDFFAFFGTDELTLPGPDLTKKLEDFQQHLTQHRLKDAGLDPSKSLEELADEAGITTRDEEADTSDTQDQAATPKMKMPQIELPQALKRAEAVTALTHPRWGQHFLSDYARLSSLLASDEGRSQPDANAILRRYLELPEITPWAIYRLAEQYPEALESLLQSYLEQPDFSVTRDLDALLLQMNKPTTPTLPETASVPLHLHNLFQEAIAEVKPEKAKPKTGRKAPFGFKRK